MMRLVLVGDKDQLPPVGPGTLLHDIIESSRIGVVRLDEIFRQESDSLIVQNAHRINQGLGLIYPPREEKEADFYFLHHEDEEKAFKTIMSLCCFNIPQKLGVPPLSPQIQVISPMYRGTCGVDSLNTELQARLNPGQQGIRVGNREFREPRQGDAGPERLRQGYLQRRHRPDRRPSTGRGSVSSSISTAGRSRSRKTT